MVIGGVAKDAVRKSEQLGKLIAGVEGVVKFLDTFFFDYIGEGRTTSGKGGNQELADYLRHVVSVSHPACARQTHQICIQAAPAAK